MARGAAELRSPSIAVTEMAVSNRVSWRQANRWAQQGEVAGQDPRARQHPDPQHAAAQKAKILGI